MIVDHIPNELIVILNLYIANINFRFLDNYLEKNISEYQTEVAFASRFQCPYSVNDVVHIYSDTLHKKWPKDLNKNMLRKLYIAQINSRHIDIIKYTEYLTIQTVKQILSLLCKDKYQELAKICSKVTTLQEARNAVDIVANFTFNATFYNINRYIDIAIDSVHNAISATDYTSAHSASVKNSYIIIYIATFNYDTIELKLKILEIIIQIGIDSLSKCKYLYLYE